MFVWYENTVIKFALIDVFDHLEGADQGENLTSSYEVIMAHMLANINLPILHSPDTEQCKQSFKVSLAP